MAAILKIRDGNGNIIELPSLQGEPGPAPYIGANGNWWVGETDTGVLAKGEKGDTGMSGEGNVALRDMELIASGELTEPTGQVKISKGNDGYDFSLRDMITVYIYIPTAAQASALSIGITDQANNSRLIHQIQNALITTGPKYGRAILLYSGRKWDCYAYATTSPTANGSISSRDASNVNNEINNIKEIRLYLYNFNETGAVLPAGFKYEIYGRRVTV